jgi:hypothetical protein
MGTLVVKRYPTRLALKVADHTYVECGTGAKGWGCWGGKTGGVALRQAVGSTLRADAIAGRDEKAGISCYLFNGVCHQASNRILKAAGISVDGIHGYTFSVAAFGVYGRQKTLIERCQAPVQDHLQILGDLAECLCPDEISAVSESGPDDGILYDYKDPIYRSLVDAIYTADANTQEVTPHSLFTSQMAMFMALVWHRSRRSRLIFDQWKIDRLFDARARFEHRRLQAELEIGGFNERLEFANHFNELTRQLQDDFAETLDSQEYEALLDLSRDERIELADPDVLEGIYEPRPGPRPRSPGS